MFRTGLMRGATCLPPCTYWVAAHCLVALISFATRFGLWPQAPAHRRGRGSCSGVPLQGWSIPPWSPSAVEPRVTRGVMGVHPQACSLCLGWAGSSLPPVASHPACLQPGAEPDNMGVNKQACPLVRGGQGALRGRKDSAVCACWGQAGLADRDSVMLLIRMALCWSGWIP